MQAWDKIRLLLKLANPYKIKQQFNLLSGVGCATVKLAQKIELNHRSHILRFRLPDEKKCLGHQLGQYVKLELDGQSRPYVPISRIDDLGYFDILVWDKFKDSPQINSFSRKLINLKIDSPLTVRGPITQFIYHGHGKISFHSILTGKDAQTNDPPQEIKKYDQFNIIAHGSGIATSFSLIRSIHENMDRKTSIYLLWLGDSVEHFILFDQLEEASRKGVLKMTLMLTQFQKYWPGLYGDLFPHHLQDSLGPINWGKGAVLITASRALRPKLVDLALQAGFKSDDIINTS